MELNPYAPPLFSDEPTDEGGLCHREGDTLWVENSVVLPRRCIFTNAPIGPEDYRLRLKVDFLPTTVPADTSRWRHFLKPGVRGAFTVTYYLSEKEFRRAWRRRMFGWFLVVTAAIPMVVLIASVPTEKQLSISMPIFGISVVIGDLLIRKRVLLSRRRRQEWYALEGLSKAFVASIEPTAESIEDFERAGALE